MAAAKASGSVAAIAAFIGFSLRNSIAANRTFMIFSSKEEAPDVRRATSSRNSRVSRSLTAP
jgi:hypothetical protein